MGLNILQVFIKSNIVYYVKWKNRNREKQYIGCIVSGEMLVLSGAAARTGKDSEKRRKKLLKKYVYIWN